MELQANASSVEMDLGGDNYGYLGLVLIDDEYVSIANTQPFISPTYPYLLNIPLDVTVIQALELKHTHSDSKSSYLDYKKMKKNTTETYTRYN